ncbi:hypothetical protein SANA_14100 [Gottschalkiaceae bacterium SANA]|nr:hypothetical protein SANA_14100 [Gottschalkiaceae bacterium SANA]
MKKKTSKKLKEYEDIIHLPHHVSRTRPQMHIVDRAAQFAPFAAVVGHEHALKEAARTTDQRKELDETEKTIIDEHLREIEAQLPNRFEIKVVYFKPDEFKDGGKYILKVGEVKKIDIYLREVQMVDGTRIAIDDIRSIVGNRKMDMWY